MDSWVSQALNQYFFFLLQLEWNPSGRAVKTWFLNKIFFYCANNSHILHISLLYSGSVGYIHFSQFYLACFSLASNSFFMKAQHGLYRYWCLGSGEDYGGGGDTFLLFSHHFINNGFLMIWKRFVSDLVWNIALQTHTGDTIQRIKAITHFHPAFKF